MRPRAISLLLCATAVATAGCGSSELLDRPTAERLQSDLRRAASAVDQDRCAAAASAVSTGQRRVENLPADVDDRLIERLREGFAALQRRIDSDCREQPATTTTAPPATTTEEAPPTTTEEAPPVTSEEPPPSSTPTDPTTTSPDDDQPPEDDSGGVDPGAIDGDGGGAPRGMQRWREERDKALRQGRQAWRRFERGIRGGGR